MADDGLYLLHIRDAIDRIRRYTHEGKEAFFTSSLLQDAVIRNLEVIGEAAKRISPLAKTQAAEIPWQLVAGMRDVLIHGYFGVDLEIVWSVVDSACPSSPTS